MRHQEGKLKRTHFLPPNPSNQSINPGSFFLLSPASVLSHIHSLYTPKCMHKYTRVLLMLNLMVFPQQADSLLLYSPSLKKSVHTSGSSEEGWKHDFCSESQLQISVLFCYCIISKIRGMYTPWPSSPFPQISLFVHY